VQITIINRQKKIPISKRAIKSTVLKVFKILYPEREEYRRSKARFLQKTGSAAAGELSVLFTDNKTIRQLNLKFTGKDEPTDVLCFDLSEKNNTSVDIVISAERACENAAIFKTLPIAEAKLYLVHGILHFLGYDDKRQKDREKMHQLALQILSKVASSPSTSSGSLEGSRVKSRNK